MFTSLLYSSKQFINWGSFFLIYDRGSFSKGDGEVFQDFGRIYTPASRRCEDGLGHSAMDGVNVLALVRLVCKQNLPQGKQ